MDNNCIIDNTAITNYLPKKDSYLWFTGRADDKMTSSANVVNISQDLTNIDLKRYCEAFWKKIFSKQLKVNDPLIIM